ncbi:MAG: hypothetical protein PVG83_03850 [Acidimicrobiia bacterium]|jgi:hypothetical protein
MVEPIESPSDEDIARFRRTLAPRDFNHTWELLDRDELSREEQEEMLASAFAQQHNWYRVGTPKNWAIADWQIARVAAVLGYADLARRFGERSLELAVEHDLGPFVTGFAHESIARAAAAVDDLETFTEHLELAKATLADIEDADDRDVLQADLTEMSER